MTTETHIENIASIFSVFHDGIIQNHKFEGRDLSLTVSVLYLAQRINPAFSHFTLELQNVEGLCFRAWTETATLASPIYDVVPLLGDACQILGGKVCDKKIHVECSLDQNATGYFGGELIFTCTAANIYDEGSKSYSTDVLISLAKAYWEDWKEKNSQ